MAKDTWMYHRTKGSKLFDSNNLHELGPEWQDHPCTGDEVPPRHGSRKKVDADDEAPKKKSKK